MFCVKCGSEVKVEGARFCWNCGEAVQVPEEAAQEKPCQEQVCVIECLQVGESFSLYGKDKYVFQAVLEGSEDKRVVSRSQQFVVTGFSYEGPSMKNKYHKVPFDNMVESMEGLGWLKDGKHGKEWYSLRFRRPVREE